MMHVPRPMNHAPHGKKEPASLCEVARWVLRALDHERRTGIGEFLTPTTRDFRGVRWVSDSFTMLDIPDDPHRAGLIIMLHSGQEFRISIEEK